VAADSIAAVIAAVTAVAAADSIAAMIAAVTTVVHDVMTRQPADLAEVRVASNHAPQVQCANSRDQNHELIRVPKRGANSVAAQKPTQVLSLENSRDRHLVTKVRAQNERLGQKVDRKVVRQVVRADRALLRCAPRLVVRRPSAASHVHSAKETTRAQQPT
jgi:hypothetical protein